MAEYTWTEEQSEPDDYCFEYYNMGDPRRTLKSNSSILYYIKKGRVYSEAEAEAHYLLDRVDRWLCRYLKGIQRNTIITTVPRSTKGELHEFLVQICKRAAEDFPNAQYRPILHRIETIPSAHTGGSRNQDLHERTIRVDISTAKQDTVIVVLDDIWTSGSTMRACKENLVEALRDAAAVRLLAIGRTTY